MDRGTNLSWLGWLPWRVPPGEFILVGLATLTGSSRLILVGLGNLGFLQVKVLFNSTSNSTSNSAKTSAKNMFFCGGFGTIGGTIRGTIFFPSSPRNTNTKEHQYPSVHLLISIVIVGLFPPTPINYQNSPQHSCPLSLPSLPLSPLPRRPSCRSHCPRCRCGCRCPCCPCCPCCPSRPSRPCRPCPCHPCYHPCPPPPPYYSCELWSHVTTTVMISTKNSTQADFSFCHKGRFEVLFLLPPENSTSK